MTALDIILIIPLIYGLYNGFKRGIVAQLGGIVGIVTGVWLAFRYSDDVGTWLGLDPEITWYAAFIIIVVAVILVIGVLGWLLGKIFNLVGLGLINRTGGIVLSLAKTVLILGALLMAFNSVNHHTHLVNKRQFNDSLLYSPIVKLTEYAFPFLEKAFEAIDFTGIKENNA
ncbi:MAG: CvpA family protein [Rikenellaceae bacterium]|nr:CvpA family protein [Rikenellaceae bacterium]